MLAQLKRDKLNSLKKQVRTLQFKKMYLLEECQNAKQKLD